ncbi:MAG: class IV adenylate cyclase [Desulfobacterales bacterium]|nr:class IV adenylate cyclase [Desulfobacterales bacterium]MDJ0874748.1 class IV adenylate cyclase [Desulfobacterales bacterium]MDJ0884601.1 class IV adenylate cyclase [Desulfobacterales bacterium]
MAADQVEIEVKFIVTDMAKVRTRLMEMGATSRGEVFETNYRYDDHAGRLRAANCLLRLRRDRQALLTYKRPRQDGGAEFKIYDEFEVVVEDFEGMHRILTAMGFLCVQIYEKRREVFKLADVMVCVDCLPFGDFIEIEGQPEGIRETARRLQFPWKRRILTNYLHIFETLRQNLNLAFRDLTFANIPTVPPEARRIIRQFEAG